ncbi:M20 family metallopeptidase [Parapusillimonas granuli]|uniref:M20 family metallopeptidase n=1 Tax=Parapusillimonas granuli TaxID=380911 RepID=A0A853FYL5_9BURK|nr:M20 family metallopeptidase [Parapusillimonas granuli]MBB5215620.1 glutamate carboxypeptidase [Parapusillimonas granuli]NYT49713.1 M20 family metallopeptidase [Parapusillimonas granuli]
MERNAGYEKLTAWLRSHQQDMFDLLERVVNIESGSYHKQGVDRVCEAFRAFFDAAGIQTTVYPRESHGNCLRADIPGSGEAQLPHVLLLGHMDTVFPEGTLEQWPYRVEGGIAYGPGVADMKAGLVMNAFVARAFFECGGNVAPIRVFFTGDEEIASPSSRELTLEMARGAGCVLNAEPGRPTGNVVIERKGAMFVDFEVEGVAAHAGVAHEKGASAIEALARKVVALHALTDRSAGVTTNVGTIEGGVSVNTVAPFAKGRLDVRYPKGVDEDRLQRQIAAIIQEASPACTCGRITHEGRFLPLFQTDESRMLLNDYIRVAQRLGVAVKGESTGGSADSGLTAAAGAPTLCATGPVGGNAHTRKEYCDLRTLVPRAEICAGTILARDEMYVP